MESKEIRNLVITGAISVVVTAGVGWFIATSSAGMDAAERSRVEAIIDEKQLTDQGTTYAQELNNINNTLIRFEVQMGHLADAVKELAEDQEDDSG